MRKDPALWGPRDSPTAAAHGSGAAVTGNSGIHHSIHAASGSGADARVLALGTPVELLRAADYETPLRMARRALAHTSKRGDAHESHGRCLYLCRVDLLPDEASGWLISEVEVGWPELFLRAQPAAAAAVADALLRHLPNL